MMKATKTTFNMIMANRSNNDSIIVQAQLKSGKWGKAFEAQRFGDETDEQIIARLAKLNNKQYRIAQ